MKDTMSNVRGVIRLTVLLSLSIVASCNKNFDSDNYTAYFGGQIMNPVNRYVLFCKDNEVLDTIPLKADNTFLKTFENLKPGMYTFRHDPEYQHVYFQKNDSIMVYVNSRDFDESVVFCGRGDKKNNFLIDLYLRNELEKNKLFTFFDRDINTYQKHIDSSYKENKKFYAKNKEALKWSDDFDLYARTMLDFDYYSKKEIYPEIHRVRTGVNIIDELPADYYDFRKKIDYDNPNLSAYSPYVSYLSQMLNNLAASRNTDPNKSEVQRDLQTNVDKLRIADTLFKNEKIKNTILNSIAFNYLLEDQNLVNNRTFLATYHKFSTDRSSKNEILEIDQAIDKLTPHKKLPEVDFITATGQDISSAEISDGRKTVFFFWTHNHQSHFLNAHRKALELKKQFPNYRFVAVNIDSNPLRWKKTLTRYKLTGIQQVRCADFESLKKKWAIIKVHRTIVVHEDGTINNAFSNLFNDDFENILKQTPPLVAQQ